MISSVIGGLAIGAISLMIDDMAASWTLAVVGGFAWGMLVAHWKLP